MTTSYAVMAHPKRRDQAEQLAQRAHIPETAIVWDQQDDEWDTGSRALATAWGDWHCVLQDDAIAFPDLRTQVEHAIIFAPERTAISLYVGTLRPLAPRVTAAVVQATQSGAAWLTHHTLLWGVAVLLPTEDIPGILNHSDPRLPYDRRIGEWYHEQDRPVLYTNPSLVDHSDIPSLLHDRRGPRRAHKVGTPDWNYSAIPI